MSRSFCKCNRSGKLVGDMASGKRKLVEKEADKNGGALSEEHPMMMALRAIEEVAELYK